MHLRTEILFVATKMYRFSMFFKFTIRTRDYNLKSYRADMFLRQLFLSFLTRRLVCSSTLCNQSCALLLFIILIRSVLNILYQLCGVSRTLLTSPTYKLFLNHQLQESLNVAPILVPSVRRRNK